MPKKTPNPADVHIGSRIRGRRVHLGRSQEWLGDQLKLTFQQVQKYEKGTNRVGGSRMIQIANALNVPPSYFYEGAPGSNAPGIVPDAAADADLRRFAETRSGIALVRAWPKLDPRIRKAVAGVILAAAGDKAEA